MQRVVHASLHGNAYAIEEAGYEALRAYLAGAAAQLAADPDRDEILGDLEQAIADKCARHLGPHKSVVTEAEMKRALDEMGPVGAPGEVGPAPAADPAGAAPPAAGPGPAAAPPVKRLYRILEGGWLGGLCNGLGAYWGLDANVVRAGFVVLTLLTHGAWLLVYLVLMFVIPAAGTPEERAAARGLPFSAQALIDEAKRHVSSLEQGFRPWRWRQHHADRRAWRQARKAARREARDRWRAAWSDAAARATGAVPAAPGAGAPHPAPGGYGHQLAAGLVVPVLAFLSALLTVLCFQLSAQLVVTGQVLAWTPGLPLWGGLLVVILACAVISGPINHARRALHRLPTPGAAWLAVWDGVLWLGFVVLIGALAWETRPEMKQLVWDLPGAWEKVRASWQATR